MKTQHLIFFFVLTLFSFNCFGQKLNSKDLVNKIWGIKYYQVSHLKPSDTLTIIKKEKAEDLLKKPFGYGFILNDNGTYEEIRIRNCGYDRKGYVGDWKLNNKTLTLFVENDIYIQMDILKINEHQLVSTNWKTN